MNCVSKIYILFKNEGRYNRFKIRKYQKVRKTKNRASYNKAVNKRCNPPRRKAMSDFAKRCANATLGGATGASIGGSVGAAIGLFGGPVGSLVGAKVGGAVGGILGFVWED